MQRQHGELRRPDGDDVRELRQALRGQLGAEPHPPSADQRLADLWARKTAALGRVAHLFETTGATANEVRNLIAELRAFATETGAEHMGADAGSASTAD